MVEQAPGTEDTDCTKTVFGDDGRKASTFVAAYEELFYPENLHNSNSPTMEEQLLSTNPKKPLIDQPLAPVVFATTRCIRKKNYKYRADVEYVPKYRSNRLTVMEGCHTASGPVLRSATSHNNPVKRVPSAAIVKGIKRRLKKGRSSTNGLDDILFKESIQKLQETTQLSNPNTTMEENSEIFGDGKVGREKGLYSSC